MTLRLDIRAPLAVVVAQFNPAIFTPPWIAKHLFGRAEGEQMEMAEVLIQAGPLFVPLTFLEGVAINVGENRTELFALDPQSETLERVEFILLKMIEVLPHTPLSAIGCNLSYVDDQPSDAITNLFQTPEGFEAEGPLNLRQSGVQLQLSDGQVLNFARTLGPQEVRYSFNYHRSESDPAQYKSFLPGMINRSISHSSGLLESLYQYDGYDLIGFAAYGEREEGSNDAQATN